LTIHHGVNETEVLFAYCPDFAAVRHHG